MMRRLLILLWLPTVAFAQQSYYGTTAVGITLSDGGDPSDLGRLPIKTGDTITAEKVRASLQVLFDTGRYRSIEVDATPSTNGTQLTFNVVRHIFFSTFELLPQELLLDRSLSTLTRLPVGQRFSEEKLEEVVAQARQALREVGYFNVEINPVVLVDTDPHLRKVELRVTTGPRAKIGEVVMEGGGQIYTDDKLRDDFHIKTGNNYSQYEIDKGANAIRQRFLDDAYLNTKVEPTDEYDAQTNTVRLKVVIDPGQRTVVEIASTGPAEIDEKEIRTLLPVYQEGALDEDLLREGQANIVEYLQQKGYFEAIVEPPKVVPAVEGGLTRITVSIEPGERHTVNSIRFVGNTVFTDKELKEKIKIRAKKVFGLNHGLFSDDLASRDVLTIQAMYKRAGYEAAFVEYKANDPGTHEIDVTFEIFENFRFDIERIDFVGNDSIPEELLREAIAIKVGKPYSPGEADDARTALTRLYYKEGFPDVRVEVSADTNPDTRNKTITYRIEEGPRYVVVQILVAGNTKTAEKVIKRTSGLKEYENFDPEKVLEAQQKLYATGLFRHVEIVPLDREMTDRRTVLIQVEEAKHILVVPGVGVKEYAGPRALLDISHTNLFGLNQSLTFRFRVGVQEQQFQTTYRQPRLFNHDDLEGIGALTLGVLNQKTYRSSGVDLSVQARKRVSAIKTFIVLAGYQTVDVREVKFSDVVFEAIRSEELTGVFQIARVGASFVRDTRDNPLNPKRGTYITNNLQIASRAWGSEVNFLSFFNQTTYQRPTGVGTLAMSSRVGWKVPYGQTPAIPITERYFAGGSMTLRGFGLDEAGPAAGGQLLTIGNVEYRVPIRSIGALGELGGAVFYDVGNVYPRPSDFTLKLWTHSVGPGLRFITPLGPVRFDVGFNLNPRFRLNNEGVPVKEKRTHVFFTLGHMF